MKSKGCGKRFGLLGASESFYFTCSEEERLCEECSEKSTKVKDNE